MRKTIAEKSPLEDLPIRLNIATGDVKNLMTPIGTESISTRTVTDWEGAALTDITVADSHSGNEILLRVAGGNLNTTKYIKVRVVTSPGAYDLEFFVELSIRHPIKTP